MMVWEIERIIHLNVGMNACAFMAVKVAQHLFLPTYVSDNAVDKRLLSSLYTREYPEVLCLNHDLSRSYRFFLQ